LKLSALGRLEMLEIACARCERRGRLRLEKLIARHGPALPLPETARPPGRRLPKASRKPRRKPRCRHN
jgi:hypothetical protein